MLADADIMYFLMIITTLLAKGGEGEVKVGGLIFYYGILRTQVYAVGVSPWPSRGVWGHAPPENFGNLDTPRTFLMHSDTCFWNKF